MHTGLKSRVPLVRSQALGASPGSLAIGLWPGSDNDTAVLDNDPASANDMTDAGKIVGLADNDIGTLAAFNHATVASELRKDPCDVPRRLGDSSGRRQELAANHPVDRFQDHIPIAAAEVGRNRIDKPCIDEAVKIVGAVSPAGRDAVECRDIDAHAEGAKRGSRFHRFGTRERRMIAVAGDHSCPWKPSGKFDELGCRRRGIVKDRRHAGARSFRGDFGKTLTGKRNGRHHGLAHEACYALDRKMPFKPVIVQQRRQGCAVGIAVCVEPASECSLLELSRKIGMDDETTGFLDRLRQEPVILGAAAECLAATCFTERLGTSFEQMVDPCG